MSEPDPPRTFRDATPLWRRAAGRPVPRRRRRRRWLHVALAVVGLLVVAAVVADHVDLDEYAVTPGVAQPVNPLIKVPAARAHRIDGPVLLTDVYLAQVTAFGYLIDEMEDAQLLPAATILGPATPPAQLAAQGYLEMAQSQAAAKAAALTSLGEQVTARDAGVVVFAVVPGSPASGRLRVGELVTAVDGRRTTNACAFSQALARHRAGSSVRLTVERTTVSPRAVLVPGPTGAEQVRLGRWPRSVPRPSATPACPGAGIPTRGFLGVEAETQVDYAYPIAISITTTSIGGPSAGLAMTLGIIDTLSNGHLTGGLTVAATGTIAPGGAVGEVGGVREKTVAVERAGATVFFVPAAQRPTAEAAATPGLKVYGVRSLTEVLTVLRRLGGSVPNRRSPGS